MFQVQVSFPFESTHRVSRVTRIVVTGGDGQFRLGPTPTQTWPPPTPRSETQRTFTCPTLWTVSPKPCGHRRGFQPFDRDSGEDEPTSLVPSREVLSQSGLGLYEGFLGVVVLPLVHRWAPVVRSSWLPFFLFVLCRALTSTFCCLDRVRSPDRSGVTVPIPETSQVGGRHGPLSESTVECLLVVQ